MSIQDILRKQPLPVTAAVLQGLSGLCFEAVYAELVRLEGQGRARPIINRTRQQGALCAGWIEIAKTEYAMTKRKTELKLHLWTEAENQIVRDNYPTQGVAGCREQLARRPVPQIRKQASKLGVQFIRPPREMHQAGANGHPPVQRNAVFAVMTQLGVKGAMVAELLPLVPSITRPGIAKLLRDLGGRSAIFQVGTHRTGRWFVASVPHAEAEASFNAQKKESKASIERAAAAERAVRQEARRVDMVKRAKAREKADAQARAAKVARCQKPKTDKRAGAVQVKVKGTRVAAAPVKHGAAYLPGEGDMSQATIRIEPTPPCRFAVTKPIVGGFASLPLGQYAAQPASCAARWLA